MKKKIDERKIWYSEDIRTWLKEHAGEYLMKRIETRKKISSEKNRDSTAKAIAQAEATLRENGRTESGEWYLERAAAAFSILPAKAVNITDRELLAVFDDIEGEMQALIEEIQKIKRE